MPDYNSYTDEQLVEQVRKQLLAGLGMAQWYSGNSAQQILLEMQRETASSMMALEEIGARLRKSS